VPVDPPKPRDLKLLDVIEGFERETIAQSVWRVARENRDPLQGGRSPSRWCIGSFDVLYTSLEKNGALAEIYELLNSQPVWPSKIKSFVHQISIQTSDVLRLTDLKILERLGVDATRYTTRDYQRTQEIADAAYFLGFSALIVPSARWQCHNMVVFTDRVSPEEIQVQESESEAVDWQEWRKQHSR